MQSYKEFETAQEAAERLGVTVRAVQKWAASGEDTPALPADDKKTLVYLVKQGDTLWAISRKYGCTVAEIVALNGELIKDPDMILVGWELKVPQN